MLTHIIDDIRNRIGRDVSFYTLTVSGCSVCSLDPNTNTSTDSYCVACNGEYWIPTFTENIINAHVTWGKADEFNWVSGGTFLDGDCRLQIKFSETNALILDSTDYVMVDDRKLRIKNIIPRGVPDINRLLINLVEEE